MKNREASPEARNAIGAMRKAIAQTDSPDATERAGGFEDIARLAVELPEATPGVIGFLDNALFCARKYASDVSEPVRNSVAAMLLAIAARNATWREAAQETAEEIGMQPSEAAKWVAGQARNQGRH